MDVGDRQRLMRAAQAECLSFPEDESKQPWLGKLFAAGATRTQLIESGEIHKLAKVLQDYDWPKLAERMQARDERRAAGSP